MMYDRNVIERLTREIAEFQEIVPDGKKLKTTYGTVLKPIYTPLDLNATDYSTDIGFPAKHPYLRGIHPSMYRDKIWTMRPYSGFGTAEETNERLKYLISRGSTGLSIALDLPTQLGLDSNDPQAKHEVGTCGTAIDSLADMEVLFDGISLERVTTSFTINSTAAAVLAMYVAVAEKQGASLSRISGTLQNDTLKEYVARGTWIFPPQPSMRLTVDTIEYCSRHLPRFNPISISGGHFFEAGANIVQELAFALADGIAYVKSALERGLKVDDFAPRLSWQFVIGISFFEGIAMLRAARRMWARLMKDRFGAQDPRSMMMRIFVGTSGASLVGPQPMNNIVRVTLETLAAVLGGCQALNPKAWDEAYSMPSEESVKLSLRTQQMIAYESDVTKVVDPLGGSYFVETLTSEIESAVNDYLKKIEEMGGVLKAIENNYIQREILKSSEESQNAVDKGERIVVGVNKYIDGRQALPEGQFFRVDPRAGTRQRAKLKALKAQRDGDRVRQSLARLSEGAKGNDNLMPYLLESVKCYATIGEIHKVLRREFGEYKENTVLR